VGRRKVCQREKQLIIPGAVGKVLLGRRARGVGEGETERIGEEGGQEIV